MRLVAVQNKDGNSKSSEERKASTELHLWLLAVTNCHNNAIKCNVIWWLYLTWLMVGFLLR